MAARSLWAQRDQEAAARTSPQGRQFMAAAPWEVGFGTAPPPAARPALKKKPPRRLPSKGSGYQHLEEELNSTPEAGSSAKAGMSPGFTGEYAEVTRDAGRRFNSGSGRGVLPASHLLVSAGNSDPAKAFFKIGGFVLLGAERCFDPNPHSDPTPSLTTPNRLSLALACAAKPRY